MLRRRIATELEILSGELAGAPSGSALASGTRRGRVALANTQARVRWLGLLMAGLAHADELHLDPVAAGFGSTVNAVDVDSGESASFTLMTGAAIDVSGDQVSMESPIGSSLLGAKAGDVIAVATPGGPRRFRVVRVSTLLRKFGLSSERGRDADDYDDAG